MSDKLNQENLFGCIRQCGGVNDNPTIQEAMKSTQTLRVINSVKMDTCIRGNCRGRSKRKRVSFEETDIEQPLPKRRKAISVYV